MYSVQVRPITTSLLRKTGLDVRHPNSFSEPDSAISSRGVKHKCIFYVKMYQRWPSRLGLWFLSQVYGWGSSLYGQVGAGTTGQYTRPVHIDALSRQTVTALSCGQYHSLAITADAKWVLSTVLHIMNNSMKYFQFNNHSIKVEFSFYWIDLLKTFNSINQFNKKSITLVHTTILPAIIKFKGNTGKLLITLNIYYSYARNRHFNDI